MVTRLVCGKYLLASLEKYLRSFDHVKFKEDDFIYGLTLLFDIRTLDFVKKKIKKTLGTEKYDL